MGCCNYIVAKVEHTGHHPRLGADTVIPINTVIRWGCCDFTDDGAYDSCKHILIRNRDEKLPIKTQDYIYNSETDSFEEAV